MPKFFFNLRNDVCVNDEEGRDLADAVKAREMAVSVARDIMSEDIKDGRLVLKDEIDVIDDMGEKVLTLPFRDAIEIED
jgi:hypothetical protein